MGGMGGIQGKNEEWGKEGRWVSVVKRVMVVIDVGGGGVGR